jgi:hypothetical protein
VVKPGLTYERKVHGATRRPPGRAPTGGSFPPFRTAEAPRPICRFP